MERESFHFHKVWPEASSELLALVRDYPKKPAVLVLAKQIWLHRRSGGDLSRKRERKEYYIGLGRRWPISLLQPSTTTTIDPPGRRKLVQIDSSPHLPSPARSGSNGFRPFFHGRIPLSLSLSSPLKFRHDLFAHQLCMRCSGIYRSICS